MFEQLCSWDNLLLAYQRASRGKRGKPGVAEFELRLEDNLLILQKELRARTYHPGEYTHFYIHEPKRRLISAAPFCDRVVHHALCNLIEPLFEREFCRDSYANRVGKGTHKAIDRAQHFSRRYRYILQCDIQKFFPSIDHAILRSELESKIQDAGVLWLIDCILASGSRGENKEYNMVYFPGDDLLAALRPRGLPIGNLTSQFWANVYLHPLDVFVKRQLGCRAYLRYVDDFLLFSHDRTELLEYRQAIMEKLAVLRQTIHPGAHPRPVCEGFPFLGFTLFPPKRRLKKRKGIHFQRKLHSMLNAYARGALSMEKLNASVRGWVNHVRFANTCGLRRKVFKQPVLPPRRKWSKPPACGEDAAGSAW